MANVTIQFKPNSSISVDVSSSTANTVRVGFFGKLTMRNTVAGSVLHEWPYKVACSLNDRILPPIAYAAFLLILSFFKVPEAWRLRQESDSRLVLVLIRDQVVCYILCALILLIFIITF